MLLVFLLVFFLMIFIYFLELCQWTYEFFSNDNNEPEPIFFENVDSIKYIDKLKFDVDFICKESVKFYDANKHFFNIVDINPKHHDILYNALLKIINTIDNINIKEILPSDNDLKKNITSYTINKGEKMYLCIRDPESKIIHKYNTVLYVVLHEFAHVGCTEIGHTELFKILNKYIVLLAKHLNIYVYENYSNHSYCGTNLNNNILS